MSDLKLNLGCGADRREGWTGVDLFRGPAVDVVHDLDVGPWPFADAAAHSILARHVFEHVADPVLFMAECHRVLEPGGLLWLVTPHWRSRDAYTDPTHRRFPTENTFDYWVKGTFLREHHGQAYAAVEFAYRRPVEVVGGELHVTLAKALP
jgi:predicted SAM-dependent methyltransferase